MASKGKPRSSKGAMLLRGGRGQYRKALVGNWEEDRVDEPVFVGTRPGFATTKTVAEIEAAGHQTRYFGNGIVSVAPKVSTFGYQDKTVTGEILSHHCLAFNPEKNTQFQEQFGSHFPLKPARTLCRAELEEYHAQNTMDRNNKGRFITEKISFQNVGIPRKFHVSQDRLLANVPVLIQDLQVSLIDSNGPHALHMLSKMFRCYDVDYNGVLSKTELKALLRDAGLVLTHDQNEAVLAFFDKDKEGTISYDEFLSGLTGHLSQKRSHAVHEAWRTLDREEQGSLSVKEFFQNTVLDTESCASEMERGIVKEFPKQWDFVAEESNIEGKEPEGEAETRHVTKRDFVLYFERLSPALRDDEQFLGIVHHLYPIPETESKY